MWLGLQALLASMLGLRADEGAEAMLRRRQRRMLEHALTMWYVMTMARHEQEALVQYQQARTRHQVK